MLTKFKFVIAFLFLAAYIAVCQRDACAIDNDSSGLERTTYENRYSKPVINKEAIEKEADEYFYKGMDNQDITTKEAYLMKALEKYMLLLDYNMFDAVSSTQVAIIHDMLGNNDTALEYFKRAVNLENLNPFANFYFAEYYFYRKNYRNALKYYLVAYENGFGDSYQTSLKIATIYEKFGDFEEAKRYYRIAQRLNPKLKEGINLLNEIFQLEPTKRPSCMKILNHPYFKIFKRNLINVIPFGIRKAMTINKTKESFSNNSRNNIIENKYRIKFMTNNDNSNYISNDKKNGIINEKKYIKQNINLKSNDTNINKSHKYNNSLNSNMRKTCKCFKNINYSNTKDEIDAKIKYIKMKENENVYVSKKILKYNNNDTEESKECENYSPIYKYYKIPITKHGRNETKYFIINTRTKRMPFSNKSIKEEKSFIDKTISRINDNSCLTLNESNNKKYNKNILKKFKNRDIINNIYSTNINKYQIYSKKNNDKNIKILDEEPTFNKKNNINIDTNQKIINHINKRDKQRKNYKFFEVHENIITNYNSHINDNIRNIQNDSNHKICICPLGRNNINNKNGLSNTNIIRSIHKISYNHVQKNLSYIKSKNNSDMKKIRLSPIKKNNVSLFGRPTSANKRKQVYCICNANGIDNNKISNRKMLINIVMTEDEQKVEPQLNYGKRK